MVSDSFGVHQEDVEAAECPSPCNAIPRELCPHNPLMPVRTAPGLKPGSYEESLEQSRALVGKWTTVVNRSDHLCDHYKHLGISLLKRAIIKRIPLPLTAFLEKEDTVLHFWIHTPIGKRHLTCDITGKPSTDTDPDCGTWHGVTVVTDYVCPWFDNGRPVRALQQIRTNPVHGTAVETRCVLPDQEFGRIMLFNYTLIPHEKEKPRISGDRVSAFNGY
eukprot:Selendium_serpulae@DN4846_c0_g1_i1.p2